MVQHVMLIEARLVARDQMEDHQRSSDGAKQGRLPDEKNKIFNMQEEKSGSQYITTSRRSIFSLMVVRMVVEMLKFSTGRGVLMGQIEIQDKVRIRPLLPSNFMFYHNVPSFLSL